TFMKTKFVLLALVLGVSLLPGRAADVLATDTVVFLQPDAKSPVITRLKAGSTIIYAGDAPPGWRRAEVSGTFEAYVHNKDITKGLEVEEGANIFAQPKKDAAILTTAQKGDKTEVTGLAGGDWCQVKIEKKLQGFVATGAMANTPSDLKPVAAPVVPAPAANPNAPGKPVASTGNTADMPRLLTGTFGVARRVIINPNPPYDYQLSDANGRRLAYVDTRRLVLTDQNKIENFLDRVVVISGSVRNTIDGKDLVVAAESLQIK
ncbi:MAG TPA: SH3 domain-containing protein, partial [Candidatus Didemnitutus sp.]|nr:SH3 domain-containing protein [Candidatus Didemnitutus sp.]